MKGRNWPAVLDYVAGAVAAVRQQRGWTQDDLARLADMDRGAVARIEQGIANSLSLRNLWAVGEALGCGVEALLPPPLPRRRVGPTPERGE